MEIGLRSAETGIRFLDEKAEPVVVFFGVEGEIKETKACLSEFVRKTFGGVVNKVAAVSSDSLSFSLFEGNEANAARSGNGFNLV